jgi:hypothetical protein
MIVNLFEKLGRFLCRVAPDDTLTPRDESLAALIGVLMLLACMAFGTVLALVSAKRIDPIEGLVFVLAAGIPWVVFDFFIKPSSQWLSPSRRRK